MKNLLLLIVLFALVGGGIGYSVLSSPDFAPQIMFKEVLKGFAEKGASLENQFISEKKMEKQQHELLVKFQLLFGDTITEKIRLEVSEQQVTLRIPDESQVLAGQSIVLEPSIDGDRLKWKCINGDVVARVRTKNCRLGVGETLETMLDF